MADKPRVPMGRMPRALPPLVERGVMDMRQFTAMRKAESEESLRRTFIRALAADSDHPPGVVARVLRGQLPPESVFPEVPWERLVICTLPEGKGVFKMDLARFFDGTNLMELPFGDAIVKSGVENPFVVYRVKGVPDRDNPWVAFRSMFDSRLPRVVQITQEDGVHFFTTPAKVWMKWMRNH